MARRSEGRNERLPCSAWVPRGQISNSSNGRRWAAEAATAAQVARRPATLAILKGAILISVWAPLPPRRTAAGPLTIRARGCSTPAASSLSPPHASPRVASVVLRVTAADDVQPPIATAGFLHPLRRHHHLRLPQRPLLSLPASAPAYRSDRSYLSSEFFQRTHTAGESHALRYFSSLGDDRMIML